MRRICLVAPDRWAGSIALGMRQHFPAVEVVCVGDAAASRVCAESGIASVTTADLLEGMRGAELILVAQIDKDSELSLHSVVSSCGSGAVVCGHGRSLAEVNGIIRDLSRSDIHYVSVGARGTRNPNGDVSLATLADIRGQSIVLTPSKIDDLDALSMLQDHLREMGARVAAMSPRVHDRQLVETIHLPRIILVPLVQYLAEMHAGKSGMVSPETTRLLETFEGLSKSNAAAWAEELARSKHHLMPALDICLKHLTALREELGTGQLDARVAVLAEQVARFTTDVMPASTVGEPVRPPDVSGSPESLTGVVGSLLSALERVASTDGAKAPAATTAMLRELAERTQLVIDRLAGASKPATQDPVLAPTIRTPEALETQPVTLASFAAPPLSEPKEPAPPTFLTTPTPALPAETAFDEVAESPAPDVAETPSGPLWFDIQCRHDLHVLERSARVLNGVHITVTGTEEMWSEQGTRVIRITLDNPDNVDRARELLRMAGIPLA